MFRLKLAGFTPGCCGGYIRVTRAAAHRPAVRYRHAPAPLVPHDPPARADLVNPVADGTDDLPVADETVTSRLSGRPAQ